MMRLHCVLIRESTAYKHHNQAQSELTVTDVRLLGTIVTAVIITVSWQWYYNMYYGHLTNYEIGG